MGQAMAAALDEELINKMFRQLGSEHSGEILAAVAKLKKLCAAKSMNLSDLVITTRSETSAKKFTEADFKIVFERGKAAGRAELANEEQERAEEFFDIGGHPRWYEITCFNRDNRDQLKNNWMREFSADIVDKVLGREPTHKQAVWILKIFVKLGGAVSRQAKARYF